MKVEILRAVMISGEPAKAGSLVEVDLATANLLIGMGKAVVAVEAPVAAPEPVVVAESEPEPAKPVRKARPTAPVTKD